MPRNLALKSLNPLRILTLDLGIGAGDPNGRVVEDPGVDVVMDQEDLMDPLA